MADLRVFTGIWKPFWSYFLYRHPSLVQLLMLTTLVGYLKMETWPQSYSFSSRSPSSPPAPYSRKSYVGWSRRIFSWFFFHHLTLIGLGSNPTTWQLKGGFVKAKP
jgi:hypothetical protein